jgi:hypothetical protein
MSTRIAASDIAENLTAQGAEAAALGALVKMSVRKRLLIRAIELIVRPIVLALQRLRGRPRNIVGESKKILVMEYWNLGDIVMLSPFLRSLRIQYPDARITSILRWWQIPSYVLGFGISHILFYTALRLWRCDFPALLAIYRGLAQGLRTPLIEAVQYGRSQQCYFT